MCICVFLCIVASQAVLKIVVALFVTIYFKHNLLQATAKKKIQGAQRVCTILWPSVLSANVEKSDFFV